MYLKSLKVLFVLTLFVVSSFSFRTYADELDDTLIKVKKLVTEKNYSAALEEMTWARKEIEKMNTSQLSGFLPDDLLGFKGAKVQINSTMGITNIERNYSKDGSSVKISMTSGSLGGAAGGLGGLGAIGQMAAMFGGSTPGQDSVRIKGRTATLEDQEGSNANLTLFLAAGPILKLEGGKGASATTLKDMASALPLDEIESYLKGSK